jgi:hypothetical protein
LRKINQTENLFRCEITEFEEIPSFEIDHVTHLPSQKLP